MTNQILTLTALTLWGFAAPAQAAIILQRIGDVSFQCCSNVAVSYSWTQSGTWSNVQIDLLMNHNGPDGQLRSGVAYLTNSLGPGTTQAANEIVDTVLATSVAGPHLMTAFSGLTLGPGTYHLVYHAANGGIGQQLLMTMNGFLPMETATGVSSGGWGLQQDGAAPYRPATSFTPWGESLLIRITGDSEDNLVTPTATPEPASGAVALCALLWIIQRRRSAG